MNGIEAAQLETWVVVWIGVVSLVTLLVYRYDKAAAIQGKWRVKESTLHALALAGGWPGALAAQRVFRHKTRKGGFQSVFWFTVAANSAGVLWALSLAQGATTT